MPFWPSKGKSGDGRGWPLGASQSTLPHTPPHPGSRPSGTTLVHSGSRAGMPAALSGSVCRERLPDRGPASACLALSQALPGADDLLFRGPVTRLPSVIRVHQAGSAVDGHVHFDLEEASGTEKSCDQRAEGQLTPSCSRQPRGAFTKLHTCRVGTGVPGLGILL